MSKEIISPKTYQKVKEWLDGTRMLEKIDEAAKSLQVREHVNPIEYSLGIRQTLAMLKVILNSDLWGFDWAIERCGLNCLGDLGLDRGKTQAGIILWNPHGRSTDGGIPTPHTISLMKTDFGRERGEAGVIPIREFFIARVPVGTMDMGFIEKDNLRNHKISTTASIIVKDTFKILT